MQQVIIAGKLGKDSEIKYFDSGKCKATFSVATDGWDGKKNEKFTNWFNVEVWEKQAEFAGEYLKKGSSIIVQGELTKETYEHEGKERTSYKIKNATVKYNRSLIVISGFVEKIESRFTPENKKVQTITVKDVETALYYKSENEVTSGAVNTFLCELSMIDYKPIIKVIKADLGAVKTEEENNESIGDDDIPF